MIFPILKFQVQEESMKPFISSGDVILVNRLSYLFKNPKIGDVVVIKNNKKKYLIKRIQRIREKTYFVVGDNKKQSIDSRNFGWIAKKDIVGKILFKI
ncbi:MAG: signal peptidase I [bacterium]|nr:signal peptidase I [bacterium]